MFNHLERTITIIDLLICSDCVCLADLLQPVADAVELPADVDGVRGAVRRLPQARGQIHELRGARYAIH